LQFPESIKLLFVFANLLYKANAVEIIFKKFVKIIKYMLILQLATSFIYFETLASKAFGVEITTVSK